MADGSGAALETYTLDEEGNRITAAGAAIDDSAFHVTDPANRLTEDENTIFEYDVNGNLIRKTVKASGETWRYGYTIFDELSRAQRFDTPDPNAPVLSSTAYRYDALGRRIAAGDRSYFYDGEHIILSFRKTSLSDYADIQFYTHSDVTDDVVALTGQDPSVTPFFASNLRPDTASAYYHTDHQGSVRAITDDNGAILNEYSYTAYGNEEAAAEALPLGRVPAAFGTVPAFADLPMIRRIIGFA